MTLPMRVEKKCNDAKSISVVYGDILAQFVKKSSRMCFVVPKLHPIHKIAASKAARGRAPATVETLVARQQLVNTNLGHGQLAAGVWPADDVAERDTVAASGRAAGGSLRRAVERRLRPGLKDAQGRLQSRLQGQVAEGRQLDVVIRGAETR